MEQDESKILFSVLIANYNNGIYLQNAIDGVLNQSFSSWEIIIVDDCSTDDSFEVYSRYANDPRFHIYKNEINRGSTYTKWRCIEESNGDFCGFLDADDFLASDALEKMVKAHLVNPTASIITSRLYYCDPNLAIIKEGRLLKIPENKSYLTNFDYQPEHFLTFKKSFYKKTKGLNINNRIGDDHELCILLEEVGKWIVIDEFLYYYRNSEKSISKIREMECYYWNIIVEHEACMRRGIETKEVSYKSLLNACKEYSSTEAYNTQKEIRNSIRYKIGNFLLLPLSIFRLKK